MEASCHAIRLDAQPTNPLGQEGTGTGCCADLVSSLVFPIYTSCEQKEECPMPSIQERLVATGRGVRAERDLAEAAADYPYR